MPDRFEACLQRVVQQQGGFLKEVDLNIIADCDRFRPILVRCGTFRCMCSAQDVGNLLTVVRAGGDYVRDVQLPASDTAHLGDYKPSSRPRPTPVLAADAVRPDPVPVWSGPFGDPFDGPSDADPGL